MSGADQADTGEFLVPSPRDGEQVDRLIAADRARIARDLHDLVIQRLFATGLQLRAAQSGDSTQMATALADGVHQLDLTIRDLRATIFELGRGSGPRLTDEVRALSEEYAVVLGLVPMLRFNGEVDGALTGATRDQVLLTLREALSNVARHARASAVSIELQASPAWFMLRVSDNGAGPGHDPGPGSGLRNAQVRAERLGGVMRTGAVEPHGFCLVWMVPTGD